MTREDYSEPGPVIDEPKRCSMGVGCDEYGVCYAEAHGRPDKCPHYIAPTDPPERCDECGDETGECACRV